MFTAETQRRREHKRSFWLSLRLCVSAVKKELSH
jgi:hypothetical protein